MATAPSIQEPKAGRPPDRRLDRWILDATVELIEGHGFRELTIVAVADRAGTTTAAIYRRWSSKADLVAHAVFGTEGPAVVADAGDLEGDLRTMVRWTLEKFGRPIGRAALAGLPSEPLGGAEKPTRLRGVWRQMDERLARAADAGEIRPNVHTRAFSGVTAVAGRSVTILNGDRSIDEDRIESIDEDRIESIVSLVMDCVRLPVGNGKPRSRGSTR